MDRTLVYPGSIPLDTDLLSTNRNVMIAIGYLAQAVLGTSTVVDGLACLPTVPASMSVTIGQGSITQLGVVDQLAYGSLAADPADQLIKTGINLSPISFLFTAPTTSGQSANFLIQATLQESDTNPIVLPYYNAANPSQPFSGANNSGVAQNTARTQRVQLQLKSGAPAATGTQQTPPTDTGWVGLYVVTVSYGQSSITENNISILPTAPFIAYKLPQLRASIGTAVQTFPISGAYSFSVPAGVSQVEVELWGGGSGSYASVAGSPSGGGSGGGYARRLVTGLTPGQSISILVGAGGLGGTSASPPTGGGTSQFGSFVSASGGSLNPLVSLSSPGLGSTSGGSGQNGDLNLTGSDGGNGVGTQGGSGGNSPMSGTRGVAQGFGNPGLFPGGGASGAGTGNGTTAFNGAAGANGLVIVRY